MRTDAFNPVKGGGPPPCAARAPPTNAGRATRGAPPRPVLDVAMRTDAFNPVKGGGPPPCQEPVTSNKEGKAPGPLNREAGLGAQGKGAGVEEIVGGQIGRASC